MSAGDALAEFRQRGAGNFDDELAIDAAGEGGQARSAEKFIDARNLAQKLGFFRGEVALGTRIHEVHWSIDEERVAMRGLSFGTGDGHRRAGIDFASRKRRAVDPCAPWP